MKIRINPMSSAPRNSLVVVLMKKEFEWGLAKHDSNYDMWFSYPEYNRLTDVVGWTTTLPVITKEDEILI